MSATIIGLASDGEHLFAKQPREWLRLVAGIGVEGDAHAGRTVQHLSRLARDPSAPNLRQLHLIQSELFVKLAEKGFAVSPGQMGENVATEVIDLLGLSRGTRLRLGEEALVEITGLRNPCRQIDANIGEGATAAVLGRAEDGTLVRKAGVMAVVIEGGIVRLGNPLLVEWNPQKFVALTPV